MTQLQARAEVETEPPSRPATEVQFERAKLKMVAGAFRDPQNPDLTYYPYKGSVLHRIRRTLMSLVQQGGLTPLSVDFIDYGTGCGPGVIIPLAESTLVIGGWPHSKQRSLDFFVHFCEREGSNDKKVVKVIELIGQWLKAKIEYSWHNPNGNSLLLVTV